MRAVCLQEQGGIDKLILDESFPDPVVGDGQVIIRVKATSLNSLEFSKEMDSTITLYFPIFENLEE